MASQKKKKILEMTNILDEDVCFSRIFLHIFTAEAAAASSF